MTSLQTILDLIAQSKGNYADVFTAVSRYIVPALAAWLLVHCARAATLP